MDYFAFTKELIATFGDLDLISRFFVFELVLCEIIERFFFKTHWRGLVSSNLIRNRTGLDFSGAKGR